MPLLLHPTDDRPQTVLGYADDPPPTVPVRPPGADRPVAARSRPPSAGRRPEARVPRTPRTIRTTDVRPLLRPSPARAAAAAAAVAARPAGRRWSLGAAFARGADTARSGVGSATRIPSSLSTGGMALVDRIWHPGAHERGRQGRRDVGASRPSGPRIPIDPRFKQRLVAVRREEGYRRLRIVILIGALATVVAGFVGALHTPWLSARQLQITGSAHLSAPSIARLTGLEDHPPMVDVDATAIARRVEAASPWVATVQVRRSWPSTVTVSVTERRAVAVVAGPSGTEIVDVTGRVLGPAGVAPGLPVVTGVTAPSTVGAWLAGSGRGSPPAGRTGVALTVAASLPPSVAAQVTGIAVSPTSDVTLTLAGSPAGVQLGVVSPGPAGTALPVSLTRQASALATLLPAINLAAVSQIDLTVPDRPALTPVKAGGTVSTTSRG